MHGRDRGELTLVSRPERILLVSRGKMEAASPPLCFLAFRACYGEVPPASRLLRIASETA